ncbi:hypothetical protein [Xylanimonas ulmi]|uniref:Lipoprotein LprG n=1 Tax=Xylanimonas ulmi TaxID=228973 RepID=A0A4Q7LZQ2_9MICO|nr:hypothetical protein [Xylanibacterium ulmi]RZS60925.1 hypothetical protein EV386_1205 [Xylanibacterium ulmi]
MQRHARSRPAVQSVARKRALALAAAALTAGALVGCGQDDASADGAGDATAPASQSTPQQQPEPLRAENFLDRVQAAQREARTARIELQGALSATGLVDMGTPDGRDVRLTMTLSASGMEQTVTLVDGVMYMPQPGAGDTWIAIDLKNPGSERAAALADELEIDPFAQIDDVKGAVTAVELVGPETLADGTRGTRYKVTVDPSLATGSTGEALAGLGLDDLVYDYVLDEEDRPLAVSTEFLGQSIAILASGWGEPVDIQAPDPSQVISAAEAGF